MDFIYLLINKSKNSGKRFYIGSKIESAIVALDGVDTIVSLKTGMPYYSSSQSLKFREDFKRGDVFEASILEKVLCREDIYDIEAKWLKEVNAADSPEYYNLTNNTLKGGGYDQEAICNIFGETFKEYASRESSLSKRDNKAKNVGFNNFGEMFVHIASEMEHKTMAEISRDLGYKRHFCRSTLQGWDIPKSLGEIENSELYADKLKGFIRLGASFYKACELTGVDIFSGRVIVGNYSDTKEFTVAFEHNKSKEELEDIIVHSILSGENQNVLSSRLGITGTSCRRYFIRGVRRRLGYDEPLRT